MTRGQNRKVKRRKRTLMSDEEERTSMSEEEEEEDYKFRAMVRQAKKPRDSWSRWHPKSYLVPYNPPNDVKTWKDPDAEIGDIIEYYRAGLIRFNDNAVACPFCRQYFFKRTALARHLFKDEFWSKREIDVFIENLEEETVEILVSKVCCYYQAGLPREIPKLPPRVEVDLLGQIPKGTKPPTAKERDAHDRAMVEWRRKNVEEYKERKPVLHRFPNGEYWDKTGDIYVWLPQVLIDGVWIKADDVLCENWSNLKLKKRVLMLLAIHPEE